MKTPKAICAAQVDRDRVWNEAHRATLEYFEQFLVYPEGATMTYRQTFVVEYERTEDAPRVNPALPVLGGQLCAIQFSDALAELEVWRECAPDEILRRVDALMAERAKP